MNEKIGIQLCLKKIEEKLDWKPSEEWTDYDFKLLKKEIQSCSGISISSHTLKRLFGKIIYRLDYNPQHATKDALANYIGYETWEIFLKETEAEAKLLSQNDRSLKISKSTEKTKQKRSKYLVPLFVISIIVVALISITLLGLDSKYIENSFTVKNREGTIPHTVTFEFDVSKVKSKHIYINPGYTHPVEANDYILIDKANKMLNQTYQVPDIYHPELIINGKVVDSDIVIVESNGWVIFYNSFSGNNYSLENMLINPEYNGYMTLSKQDMIRYGFDTVGIYTTTHRNVKDFGLSGDNFKYEIKFRNGMESGISCFDSRFSIVGELSTSHVWFEEENCFQYCELKFGENHYEGETEDLTFLSRDISEWTILRIEVVDKNATVYINNEKVYDEQYRQSSGKIKCLQSKFKGSGMMDYLLLMSVDNDTVFYDDFVR